MPKAHIYFTYKFDELDDQAKDRAREWYREVALDHDWWDGVYMDADCIGLTITEFDVYRSHIKGELQGSVGETVQAILANHGKDTDTHKLAKAYYYNKHWGHVYEGWFEHDLLDEYLCMLRREYEWLLSDECVDESIISNEYEFTSSGDRA